MTRAAFPVLAVIMAAFFVAGCAPTWQLEPLDFIGHVRNYDDLHTAYRERGGKEPEIRGFAEPWKKPCEIWIRTDRMNTPTVLHELYLHCQEGQSH